MVLGGALGPGLGGRDALGAASLLRGRRGTILHHLTSTVVLRGRRGTDSHVPSFCVAGVALWYWVAPLGLV